MTKHESKSWYDMKSKSTKKADLPESLSNKDIVKEKHPKAECIQLKSGRFHICIKSGKNINPVRFGLSKNESDAWKKAAHEVI